LGLREAELFSQFGVKVSFLAHFQVYSVKKDVFLRFYLVAEFRLSYFFATTKTITRPGEFFVAKFCVCQKIATAKIPGFCPF
jgi:hypothetical protein